MKTGPVFHLPGIFPGHCRSRMRAGGLRGSPGDHHPGPRGGGRVSLPVKEGLYGELLSLPLYPALTEADVSWICGQVSGFLGGRRKT
jgi:hypothetical protein